MTEQWKTAGQRFGESMLALAEIVAGLALIALVCFVVLTVIAGFWKLAVFIWS